MLLITANNIPKYEEMIADYYFYLGISINPFDDELITKLLQRVIKFPNEHHKSGYVEQESDLPIMRSEFKLGMYKLYGVLFRIF